jgi:hypothetical protein
MKTKVTKADLKEQGVARLASILAEERYQKPLEKLPEWHRRDLLVEAADAFGRGVSW